MNSDASSAVADRSTLPALIAVGLIAGLTASIFGVGGGIVMVPLLIGLLSYEAKAATATSLAAIIFTAIVGTATHGALGNVDWDRGLLIGVPAMLGVTIGVRVKDRISSRALTFGFAGLMVLIALRLALGTDADPVDVSLPLEVALVITLGIAAGIAAGLFGVGGGIVFVPTLVIVLGMEQLGAEATSLLAIIPVALLGSWQNSKRGNVRWNDATLIGAVSVVTAIGGAFIADVAPEAALQVGFAVLLVATAAQLALRARRA
jgi:uncharacterized membrane protein YfcA